MNIGFSKKQVDIIKFCLRPKGKDGLIADGAIRSGKTSVMAFAFVYGAMYNFNQQCFIIAGKTVKSAERNIIKPLLSLAYMKKHFKCSYNTTSGVLKVSMPSGAKTNYFYVFGGKDEASYSIVQGLTSAGALLDEVVLMPRSFVDQVIARCSVPNSIILFSDNPSNPQHYFKTDFIDEHEKKNLKYLHFTMDDNPSLDEHIKERYKSMYSGVFYQRYIEGLWVAAEGAIYKEFIEHEQEFLIDEVPKDDKIIFLTGGVDFGGSKSSTAFVTCGIGLQYKTLYILDSNKLDSNLLNTDELCNEFAKYINNVTRQYMGLAHYVNCDNAEPLHVRDLQQTQVYKGLRCSVAPAIKREINTRIRMLNILITQRRLKIVTKGGKNTEVIKAIKSAVWDDKKSTVDQDVRLDNGTYCVDLLDAMEYSFERFIDPLTKAGLGLKVNNERIEEQGEDD